MDNLAWLQNWYAGQCDGDWEHQKGIEIGTIDNPGWRVHIDLAETELEGRPFPEVKRDRSEHDWIRCWIKDGSFDSAGGKLNLLELIEVFRTWAETPSP